MRRTSNATIAMRRMADRMGLEVVKTSGAKYRIPGIVDHPINAKRCLARMVRLAQFSAVAGGLGLKRDQVREAIKLTAIASYGMPGPEADEVFMVLTHS